MIEYFWIQGVKIEASRDTTAIDGSVIDPEILVMDERRGQKDMTFSGRDALLKLRAAVDFALNDKG